MSGCECTCGSVGVSERVGRWAGGCRCEWV